jgi:hypothetical protein
MISPSGRVSRQAFGAVAVAVARGLENTVRDRLVDRAAAINAQDRIVGARPARRAFESRDTGCEWLV